MSRFVLTPAAEDDIREILDYIERDNPPAVARVREGLRDGMRLIAERPGVGHIRTDLTSETVRFWSVFSYLIIYRPETEPVQIVRSAARQTRRAPVAGRVAACAERRLLASPCERADGTRAQQFSLPRFRHSLRARPSARAFARFPLAGTATSPLQSV